MLASQAVSASSLVAEQKHPPEPGHPRGAGSHLGAPRPASPPAEPQNATGNDCPAASRAGASHATEPRATHRGANQTLHCCGGPWCRCPRFGQWQGSKGSFETLAEQRQERCQHVTPRLAHLCGGSADLLNVLAAGQLSCSVIIPKFHLISLSLMDS